MALCGGAPKRAPVRSDIEWVREIQHWVDAHDGALPRDRKTDNPEETSLYKGMKKLEDKFKKQATRKHLTPDVLEGLMSLLDKQSLQTERKRARTVSRLHKLFYPKSREISLGQRSQELLQI